MTGFSRSLAMGVFAAATLFATQVFADSPTLLGAFKSWTALQSASSDGKSCYAMSQPKSTEPKKAKRDPIYFLINTWPSRHAKDEVEIVPGYEYKADSTVTVQVGKSKFELFTKNDGGAGAAWVNDSADETRLVDAMRHGAQVIVSGTSMRGTATRDTYSLSGIGGALDRAHSACGM